MSRAYSLWCHPEQRRGGTLRILRERGDDAPDGLAVAIDTLLDTGISEAELYTWFERALVMPVITAHPTEARRRSWLDHLARIGKVVDELHASHRSRTEAALDAEVLALYATEDARARRPAPLDEVENALDVFRRSLLDVTPRIYRTIEDRVRARYGGTWRAPTFLPGVVGWAVIETAIPTSARPSAAL
jgi:phosphoenolpyruvate carboxylase